MWPTDVLETKVALPAVVVPITAGFGTALYKLLTAYDVIHPNDVQRAALMGAGSFVLYCVQVLTGYYAPHTPRPLDDNTYPS